MEPRSYFGQPAAVFRRSPATLPTRCVSMVSERSVAEARSDDLGGETRSRTQDQFYTADWRSDLRSKVFELDPWEADLRSRIHSIGDSMRRSIQHRRTSRSLSAGGDQIYEVRPKSRLHGDRSGEILVDCCFQVDEEWKVRHRASDERWNFRIQALKKMMDIGLSAMDNDRWAKFQEERSRLLKLSSKKRADDDGAPPRTPRCPLTVRSNVPGMLPKHKEAYYTLVAAQSPARATRSMVQVDGPTAVRLSTINDSSNRSRSLTAASSLVEGPLLSSAAPKVNCSRPVRQNVQPKLHVHGQTLTAEFRGLIRKENTREVVVVNLEKSARKSFHCAKYTIKGNATLMSGNEPGLSAIQSMWKERIGGLPVEVSFCTVMSANDFPSMDVMGNANCMLNMVLEAFPISILFPLKPPPEPPPLLAGPVVPSMC